MFLKSLKIKKPFFLLFPLPLIVRSQGTTSMEIGPTNGPIALPGTLSYPIVQGRIPLSLELVALMETFIKRAL